MNTKDQVENLRWLETQYGRTTSPAIRDMLRTTIKKERSSFTLSVREGEST